jgi:hypothetical protein
MQYEGLLFVKFLYVNGTMPERVHRWMDALGNITTPCDIYTVVGMLHAENDGVTFT